MIKPKVQWWLSCCTRNKQGITWHPRAHFGLTKSQLRRHGLHLRWLTAHGGTDLWPVVWDSIDTACLASPTNGNAHGCMMHASVCGITPAPVMTWISGGMRWDGSRWWLALPPRLFLSSLIHIRIREEEKWHTMSKRYGREMRNGMNQMERREHGDHELGRRRRRWRGFWKVWLVSFILVVVRAIKLTVSNPGFWFREYNQI